MKAYESDEVRALSSEMAMAIINYVDCSNENERSTRADALALVSAKVKIAALQGINREHGEQARAIREHLAQQESR